MRASGLDAELAEEVVESNAFGPLTAELRRVKANHHDLTDLFPRLVQARNFGDADDIAVVMRHRLTAATARPAGAGPIRRAPRLIVGLVPEAMGPVADDMRQALDDRRDLITQRVDAVLDKSIADGAQWIASLGEKPTALSQDEPWRIAARMIAAYRDRYSITAMDPLGARPNSTVKRIDYARAESAINETPRANAATDSTECDRDSAQRVSTGRAL